MIYLHLDITFYFILDDILFQDVYHLPMMIPK